MDWLTLPDFVELPKSLLAQTPLPSPSPSSRPSPTEVELLKSQLEFLRQSQNQFAEAMKQFVDAMKTIFIVLGIAGGVAAYFFGKNFKDFQEFVRKDIKDFQEFSRTEVQNAVQRVRQEAETQIPHLVETEVKDLIRAEVATVERMLRREQVIKSTQVDYYLPDAASKPNEIKFIEARNFERVRFCDDLQVLRRDPGDVVVLDLQNWVMSTGQRFCELPEKEQQEPGKQQIDSLLNLIGLKELSDSTVVVVYIRGRIFYLNEIKDKYVIAANNPVTLVGTVVDGAYVVVGDRKARNS